VVGVPGFYRPRMPPAALMPHGHPDGLSLYDTQLLRGTLERLVDFDLINGRQVASGQSTFAPATRPTSTMRKPGSVRSM